MAITQTLFHSRTIKKVLSQSSSLKEGEIPAKAKSILQKWHDLIISGEIKKHKETNLQSLFANELCGDILGYKPVTKKIRGSWSLVSEEKVGSGSVDICLGKFTNSSRDRQVMLELKGANTSNMDKAMGGRKHSTVDQARNYAHNSGGETQWFMVSNCIEIRLYKYPESGKLYQSWQIAELLKPKEYERFMLLLGAKNLVTGKSARLYKQSLQAEKDITNELYADYRDIRIRLINDLKRENNSIRRADMIKRAQTLLDRILFIAFAEDRELLPLRTLQAYIYISTDDNNLISSWDRLKILFNAIDKGNPKANIPRYNGDLFKPNTDLESLDISDEVLQQFQRLWEYDFATDISETILGHIFEQSIEDLDKIYASVEEDKELQVSVQTKGTTGKRKKQGVVYTPDFITSWIVENTLGAYLTQQKKDIEKGHQKDSLAYWQSYRDTLATTRICDPACGSGAFLVAAFKYLKQEFKMVNSTLDDLGDKGDLFSKSLNNDILNNNLFGVDINAESVEIARLSLWLTTAETGKPLVSLKDNIQQGNSIINHKKDDKNAFSWRGQFSDFDVVLGNPPYVRQERLSEIKPYLEKYYHTYHGVADLYTYFFELGLKILKKGGYLGYISSSTFFKTGSGKNLRQHLGIHANLKAIVDFGDLQVFEGVTTYPAVLVMSKPSRARQKAPESKLNFWNVQASKLDELKAEMLAPKWGQISQHKLAEDGWRLEDERLQALRKKIIGSKPTLKEVYGQPLYGLKTGLNAAFVINELTYNQIITANPASLENLKPFLVGKDLKQWRAESRHLYLILFPRGWTRQQMEKEEIEISEAEAWDWLRKKHQQICEWLEPFAEKGRKRGDKGEFWWELRACAYYDSFKKAKIVYNRFMPSPLFWVDTQKVYFNNALNLIKGVSFYELGLLNSHISWFFLKSIASAMSGGFYQIHGHVLEKLPIPKATKNQQENISNLAESCQNIAEQRYALEHGLRQQIPNLCPEDRDPKLNNKLKSWWMLSFDDFKKEIKKQYKQAMSLQDSIEWQSLFDSTKIKIQNQNAELVAKEQRLNNTVYELFKLDNDEISLLEESLC